MQRSTSKGWIGIDITHLAIGLIKHRLRDTFGDDITQSYEVIGEPVSIPDAELLGKDDPFQFQWWALGLVGARPVEQKKGADKGIDGRLYFHDDVASAKTKQIIFSVKAGRTSVPHYGIYAASLSGRMPKSGSCCHSRNQPSPCGQRRWGQAFTSLRGARAIRVFNC